MEMWLFWLILSGFLLVIEIFTVSFLAFFPAIGAFLAYISAVLGFSVSTQIIVFAIASSLLIIFMKPLISKFIKVKDNKTNIHSIVGKTGIVTEKIDNVSNKGVVNVDGELWTAMSSDEEDILEKGTKVTVQKVTGVKLIVTKL